MAAVTLTAPLPMSNGDAGPEGGGRGACRRLLGHVAVVPLVDGAGCGLKSGVDGGCTPHWVLLFHKRHHAGYVGRRRTRP